MKRFLYTFAFVGVVAVTNLRADDATVVPATASTSAPAEMATTITSSQVQATPEMWFYEQEVRRADDPRTIIRERAALQTAQRQARLAAMQWYGLSNSRPVCSPNPFTNVYSARWVSNGYNPNEWIGSTGGTTIYYIAR